MSGYSEEDESPVAVIAVPASLAVLLVAVLLVLVCGVCVRKKKVKRLHNSGYDKAEDLPTATNAAFITDNVRNYDPVSSSVRPPVVPPLKAIPVPLSTATDTTYDYSLPIDAPIDNMDDSMSYSYARSSTLLPPLVVEEQKEMASPTETTRRRSARESAVRQYETPAADNALLLEQILEIFQVEELRRDSIKFGKVLGEGNFGSVCEGEFVNSKGQLKKVAVKSLKEGAMKEDRLKFLQEAAIMVQFKHPNVVKVHGVVIADEPALIVLELLTNGDMANYLIKERIKVPQTIDKHTLLSFCRQIAAGMVYLSNKSFVHRDLAARNILLSQYGVCKIADFGLSRDLMDEVYYVSRGGKIPVKWTAPEALHYKKYSTASDVWSFGIVMYEIWSLGKKPYIGLGVPEIIRIIDVGYRLPPPPGCPRAIYEAMIHSWHPTTSMRPMFEDLAENLSMPDTVLLDWSEKDGPPLELGGDTDTSDLFQDLQYCYSSAPSF